jgi:hypothetical protein
METAAPASDCFLRRQGRQVPAGGGGEGGQIRNVSTFGTVLLWHVMFLPLVPYRPQASACVSRKLRDIADL